MSDMTLFPVGARWVLLDERAFEIGQFETQSQALEAAGAYVRRLAEPRYIMICEDEWRERLLRPTPT
ncbi:hypothetical protein [Phenylobacterium sp.]|jgi:hypothetical protein|uniref:hypothetical protein n=1 Tax=Phenylobacterium sp. TaxID=1871053 RepID=UPI002E323A43|nr:hypothetical protein [Phenylobacterium sp.]HEX2560030.1 hypothetical protein [Phenylobacterium sp.]